ncbi:EamA/RhaT family transporter, partial [Rhizobium ruizarguesonis]
MTMENPARRLAGSEHEKGGLRSRAATRAGSASGGYSRLLTTDVWTAIAW